MLLSCNLRNLNFLDPSGPLRAFNGTALPLYIYIYIYIYISHVSHTWFQLHLGRCHVFAAMVNWVFITLQITLLGGCGVGIVFSLKDVCVCVFLIYLLNNMPHCTVILHALHNLNFS